jgi:hypothetical protein
MILKSHVTILGAGYSSFYSFGNENVVTLSDVPGAVVLGGSSLHMGSNHLHILKTPRIVQRTLHGQIAKCC